MILLWIPRENIPTPELRILNESSLLFFTLITHIALLFFLHNGLLVVHLIHSISVCSVVPIMRRMYAVCKICPVFKWKQGYLWLMEGTNIISCALYAFETVLCVFVLKHTFLMITKSHAL